jgi:hypothetical protein
MRLVIAKHIFLVSGFWCQVSGLKAEELKSEKLNTQKGIYSFAMNRGTIVSRTLTHQRFVPSILLRDNSPHQRFLPDT